MVLNRNPDNFFAETEQVAFCAAHIVPGIDFTNDPLLAGRIHSYVDTQISRLGGPNFHEIPINSPVAQVHNNQRDGMHRQAIHRGRVAYEPNSLGGGCPFQAGARGFTSFPQPVEEDKVRGKPEKFADHYTQAALFYNSQTRDRAGAHRARVPLRADQGADPADPPARGVATRQRRRGPRAPASPKDSASRCPEAQPAVRPRNMKPEVKVSPPLSLMARPGDGSIRTRCIALLVADGIVGCTARGLHRKLADEGAVPRFIGARLGTVRGADGTEIDVEVTLETAPSVLFDAVVVPDGDDGIRELAGVGTRHGIPEGPVPPLQDHPGARRGRATAGRGQDSRR